MTDALGSLWLDLKAVAAYAVADSSGLFVAWTVILGGLLLTAAFLFGMVVGSREAKSRLYMSKLWVLVGELRARLEHAEAECTRLREELRELESERMVVVMEQARRIERQRKRGAG